MRSGGQKNLLVSATAIENQTRLYYTLTAVSRFFWAQFPLLLSVCVYFSAKFASPECVLSGVSSTLFKVKIETVSKAKSIKFAAACSQFPHFSEDKSSYFFKHFCGKTLWNSVRDEGLILGGAIMYLFLLDVSTRSLSPPCPIASRYIHRANRGQIFGFPTRSPLSLTARWGEEGLKVRPRKRSVLTFPTKKPWGKWIRFSSSWFY